MDELALEAGSDAIVRELIVLFLEDVSQRGEELKQAVTRGDRGGRERVAHSIKGSAANLGAERLATLASAIERCSNEEARGELAGIAEEFEALKRALAEQYP
jgi:two-component system, sensor histidine kinase and response regulator